MGALGSGLLGTGSVLMEGEPASSGGGSSGTGFFASTFNWAVNRVPALFAGRMLQTDFLDASGGSFFVSGAAAPTFNTGFSGGVLNVPGAAGFGEVDLGATAAKQLIAAPKVEPWAAKVRVRFTAAAFTAATQTVPIAIDNSTGTGIINILSIPGTSTTVFQFQLFDNVATGGPFSCGTVGTLGGANCPVGAFFNIGLWFDGVQLGVEFNDVAAFAPLTGANLAHMPTGPLGVSNYSNDLTLGMKTDCMALVVL